MREPGRLVWHLESAGVSVTQGRIDVYNRFLGERATIEDVIASGVAKTTAYRTIKLFLKIGVLQEVEAGLYELTDRHRQHHHYKLCRVCERRIPFNNAALEHAIHRLDGRDKRGFALEDHMFEIRGVCGRCQQIDDVTPHQPIGEAYLRRPGA